ncbi:MAG: hypothetical protein HKM95_07400 [Inquilinus sp.]|nr:hypothetical protein [Inquilinus sp.]
MMKSWALCLIAGLALGVEATAGERDDQATTDRLQAALDEQGVALSVGAHCGGDFTGGGSPEHAFAALDETGTAGAYYAYAGGALFELAEFAGRPELRCLSPSEAADLNAAIAQAEAVSGSLPDSPPGHIVCGFIDSTEAHCWGYDRSANAFVKVGGWVT